MNAHLPRIASGLSRRAVLLDSSLASDRALAPQAVVTAELAAILAGTPERIVSRRGVAILFDFSVVDGLIRCLTFRAEAQVVRRDR